MEVESWQIKNLRSKECAKMKKNVYTIDFVVDGDIRKALDTRTAKSLEWLLEFGGADSGDVIVEYLDPLGNL